MRRTLSNNTLLFSQKHSSFVKGGVCCIVFERSRVPFFFIAIVFIKKRTKNIREIKTSFLHGGEKSNHHLCFEDDDDESDDDDDDDDEEHRYRRIDGVFFFCLCANNNAFAIAQQQSQQSS